MADIEPPSFSLGLDLDFESSHNQNPPQSFTQQNDIIPPSFSLGLDLEFEPSHKLNQPESSNQIFNAVDESQWHVSDSDLDSPENPPRSRFRRLRRGGPLVSTPIEEPPVLKTPNFVEDDIEDFSEEEIVRPDPLRVTQHQTLCSSSKLPLSGCGVLKRPQESTAHYSQRKQDSSCPPSTSVASNKGKSVLPDFTSSPLRRFQLLDSDSDDQSGGVRVKGNDSKVNMSKNIIQNELNQKSSKIAFAEKTDLSASTSQKQDLWKNFHVDNNVSVPTPVFDELLKEYYNGGKQNKAVSGSHEFGSSGMASSINDATNFMETETLETAGLPCRRYFFHDDYRIQRLVHSRLPYFCPLSVSYDTRNMPYNASSIDYRSQFCTEDGATANQRAGRNLATKKSSKRPQKRNKKANIVEDSHATGTWIDLKQTTNTPTVAGKRRVLADGQSPGHWFTGDNGKKVYVTKTGKELTGRLAYMHFTKEKGGSRKPRKKRASKKK